MEPVQPIITTLPLKTSLGEARIIRVRAGQMQHPRPVYFNGGYGTKKFGYMLYLAMQHGLDMFTVIYGEKRPRDEHYWLIEKGQLQLARRRYVRKNWRDLSCGIVADSQRDMADHILQAMDQLEIARADAIGQCAGTMRVMELMRQAPGRFANVILPYPAGLTKIGNWRVLQNSLPLAGVTWRLRHELFPHDTTGAFLGSRHMRTLVSQHEDAKSIFADGDNTMWSHHNMADVLPANCPRIGILSGLQDYLFLPQDILRYLTGHVRWMRVLPGMHGMRHSARMIDMVARTLKQMDDQPLRPFALHLPPDVATSHARTLQVLAEQVSSR